MHSDKPQSDSTAHRRVIILVLILCATMVNHVVLAMAFFGTAPDFLSIKAPAMPDSNRQDQLEHLLIHDCGSCHGMTLAGGLGSPLTVSALHNKPESYLFTAISEGIPGTPMPSWAPLLSETDIEWLVARLLKGERP